MRICLLSKHIPTLTHPPYNFHNSTLMMRWEQFHIHIPFFLNKNTLTPIQKLQLGLFHNILTYQVCERVLIHSECGEEVDMRSACLGVVSLQPSYSREKLPRWPRCKTHLRMWAYSSKSALCFIMSVHLAHPWLFGPLCFFWIMEIPIPKWFMSWD